MADDPVRSFRIGDMVDDRIKTMLLYAAAQQNPSIRRTVGSNDATVTVRVPKSSIQIIEGAMQRRRAAPPTDTKGSIVGAALIRYSAVLKAIGLGTSPIGGVVCQSDATVLRTVDDIYDRRFADEAAATEPVAPETGQSLALLPFPEFVAEFFAKRFGVREIVTRRCLGFLASLEAMRNRSIWADMFGRFVDGSYSASDLTFFLYSRAVVTAEASRILAPRVGAQRAASSVREPWRDRKLCSLPVSKCRSIADTLFTRRGSMSSLLQHRGSFENSLNAFLTRQQISVNGSLGLCELYHVLVADHHSSEDQNAGSHAHSGDEGGEEPQQHEQAVSSLPSEFRASLSSGIEVRGVSSEPISRVDNSLDSDHGEDEVDEDDESDDDRFVEPEAHEGEESSVAEEGDIMASLKQRLSDSFTIRLAHQLESVMNEYLDVVFGSFSQPHVVLRQRALEKLEEIVGHIVDDLMGTSTVASPYRPSSSLRSRYHDAEAEAHEQSDHALGVGGQDAIEALATEIVTNPDVRKTIESFISQAVVIDSV